MNAASDGLFLEFVNADIRKGSSTLFKDFTWKIYNNQQWAIVGPTGSGKTSLAEAIIGKNFIEKGRVHYYFLNKHKLPNGFITLSDYISYLSFKEDVHIINYDNLYYQQRYNTREAEDVITVEQYFNMFISYADEDRRNKIFKLFNINELLPLQFVKLSNGQTRKVLIARTLLKNPLLLILDNPFTGLDTESRKILINIIDNLIAVEGIKIILITGTDELPKNITHVLQLDNFTINETYSREDYEGRKKNSTIANSAVTIRFEELDEQNFDIAAQLNHVTVRYDEKVVLDNVNWTVKKGEKWALLGANGSGKTTLLSLINADHPQSYANDIVLFDKKRGTGESIWDIKKKIGFLSPELHLYFPKQLNAFEVAATGFFEKLYGNRQLTQKEKDLISHLFNYFSLESVLTKNFSLLSTGEQRIILFIRALVKNAPLLILDEPYQGLDALIIDKCQRLLSYYAQSNRTIIFVSHYKDEIPSFITRYIYLENGKAKLS